MTCEQVSATIATMNPTQAIQVLLAAKRTESRIAADAGTTQGTINKIKHGRTPRYDLGLALVAEAKKAMRTKAYKESGHVAPDA